MTRLSLLSLALLVPFSLPQQFGLAQSAALSAPAVAPVRPVVDDYFGTKVTDPYRYMENLSDPEVQAWFKAQNDFARTVLARIPGRTKMVQRLRELDHSAPASVTDLRRVPGDLYFYEKLKAGEDLSSLYLRHGSSGEEKLILDPEKIKLAPSNQSKGKASIQYYVPSLDARLVIVGVAPGGSEDDTELHVIEAETGKETGDVILRASLGDWAFPAWLPGNRSFTYNKLEPFPPGAPPDERYDKFRSYLHVLGADPHKDAPIFGYGVVPSIAVDRHAEAFLIVPPGSRYAVGVIDIGIHQNNAYYIADVSAIGKPDIAWRKVAGISDDVHDIAIHGDDLFLLSFHGAPRYKILRTGAGKPDLASAQTVLAPGEPVVIGMQTAQDGLYVQLLDGGVGRLLKIPYAPGSSSRKIQLPYQGRIWGAVREVHEHGYNDLRVAGVVFNMTGWTKAPKIYRYDPYRQSVTDTKMQPAGPLDEPADLDSVEVRVPSYDHTMVPLSIVYRKGLTRDGTHATHLTGYGAYGNVQAPYYWPGLIAFYEQGGISAICHVRGGGEYGEEWHLAGKGATKPNTWRDFIACAQYLIDQKYTSPAHISAYGASAGGILIGRAITERPDLFGAAIIISGVVNALRMEATGNGPSNFPEFGNTKTQEGFKALYEMDAVQHVKEETAYPAVLLEIGMNDPRVDPWISAKLAARLEAATTSGKPVLLRVEYGGGHFGDPGYNAALEQAADEICFDLWQLGVPAFQPQ
jgi:prolyl oligopeptidase